MIIDISDAVVLDKKSFKDKYLILTIWQLSPFWKVFNSFFKQFEFPFSIWMLCTTFCLILPNVLREQQFEKFTDRQTDDGQCVIRKADLNLLFRWAKYQKNKKKQTLFWIQYFMLQENGCLKKNVTSFYNNIFERRFFSRNKCPFYKIHNYYHMSCLIKTVTRYLFKRNKKECVSTTIKWLYTFIIWSSISY